MNPLSKFIPFIITLFSFGFLFQTNAQSDKELIEQLAEENLEAVNALVLYPKDIRIAIFEAGLHPEIIIRLESIQSKTSKNFQNLLETYTQEVQADIWELTRYPDLISSLVDLKTGKLSGIEEIYAAYPEIIHQKIRTIYEHYPSVLQEIQNVQERAELAFENLISNYSLEAQEVFRSLIPLPEVLKLLAENIELTILVADFYENDPEWVLRKTDSLSIEVARQNAQELADWKESLESNPAAKTELEASAKEFSQSHSYDDVYYDPDNQDPFYEGEEDIIVEEYHHYHYPYWFGYPHWYISPHWRPYPIWYDWGFHVSMYGEISIIYFPSYYYFNWYFLFPSNHYRYPHLSAHFIRHYHRYRFSNSSISSSVSVWKSRNERIVSKRFLEPDNGLERRLKEYGKFETARTKYNVRNKENPKSATEFLERNKVKYPNLNRTATKQKQAIRTPETAKSKLDPVKRPTKTKNPGKIVIPKKKTEVRKTDSKKLPKITEGKIYHRSTWEKSKSKTPIKTVPRKATKTKTSPVKKTTTKTSRVKKKNN